MAKMYLTQKELAEFCGCKQPYIAKLKKKGLFDDCLENNKFLKSKATEYAKIIEDNKDLNREPQRIANEINRNGGDDLEAELSRAKNSLESNNSIFDVMYLGEAAQNELEMLITTGKSSVQKIQIKDAFIESKKKEIEFKKDLGVLIELEEAEALIELVASNMKTKMYNIPHLMKSKYSKITKEQVEYMYSLIDNAFDEFHKFGIVEDE